MAVNRNHRAYADKHGYRYRFVSDPPKYYPALARAFEGIRNDSFSRRHPFAHPRARARLRAFLALEAFAEGFSTVLLLDSNTLFVDARSLTAPPFGPGAEASLFFSGSAAKILDSGALVIRRTTWAVDVLLNGLTDDSPRWGRCGDGAEAEWIAAVARGPCAEAMAPGCTRQRDCSDLQHKLPLDVRDHVQPLPPEDLSVLGVPAVAGAGPWGLRGTQEVWPAVHHPRLASAFIVHFPGALSEQIDVWARFLDADGVFSFPVSSGDFSKASDEEVHAFLTDEASRQPPLPKPFKPGRLFWLFATSAAVAVVLAAVSVWFVYRRGGGGFGLRREADAAPQTFQRQPAAGKLRSRSAVGRE